ncbi:MAG: hypothetical protein QHH15_04640 [Candidatus Thermoplasmatota archaeon]|jgi:hypothetical protein|nr:hypothetical protein [Candidatus Thermoplasmatota archaeon]
MGEELFDAEEFSKMFCGKKGTLTPDQELAINIIHRFNICRDSFESMPALEEHIESLFLKPKDESSL